jgi:hypothetical protein
LKVQLDGDSHHISASCLLVREDASLTAVWMSATPAVVGESEAVTELTLAMVWSTLTKL